MTDTTQHAADPAAIDLEAIKNRPAFAYQAAGLIAAVEALRKRVAETNSTAADHFNQWVASQERYEAAEAREIELAEAVDAGKKLSNWIAEAISKATYEAEERKNPDAWEPLSEAMHNGWMASFQNQFDTALAATPVEALGRAKAKDEVVKAARSYSDEYLMSTGGIREAIYNLDALTPAKESQS